MRQGLGNGIKVTALAALQFIAVAGWAGQGVININQHRVLEDAGCTYPRDPCLYNETTPFPNLEVIDNEIDVFAYHVNPYDSGLTRDPLTGRFCQAVCDATFASRPKIISSDWSGISNSEAQQWLRKICDDATDNGGENRGRLHFEHFEPSLNTPASAGDCLGGYSTWNFKAQQMIGYFSTDKTDCGDELPPNGTLQRGNDDVPQGDLDRLYWRTPGTVPPDGLNKVTLTGFGFMGAVAMGDRLDTLAYLRSLRSPFIEGAYRKGANFTRIWATEQWTAQAPDEHGGCHTPNQTAGPVPFEGVLQPHGYHLDQLSPRYFSHLRSFVQAAADRGIVVQFTLFDKHGLLYRGDFGCQRQWPSSPYNETLNNQGYLDVEDLPPACDCNSEGPFEGPQEAEECPAHPEFVSGAIGLAQNHSALIQRAAQEVGGIGNVMFEIVNEAIAGVDWPGANSNWQNARSTELRLQLPAFVARDAFNDEANGQGLHYKFPDAGLPSGRWQAQNSVITSVQDSETGIRMGFVRGNSSANWMRGALQLDAGTPWAELGVRAKVSRKGNNMELGFSAGGNPTGNLVRIELGSPLVLGTCTRIAIVKRAGGGSPIELASTCIEIEDGAEIHFRLDVTTRRASVFLDSAPVAALTDIYIGSSLPSGLSHAYFRGSKTPAGTYTANDGEIDNFEASVYN